MTPTVPLRKNHPHPPSAPDAAVESVSLPPNPPTLEASRPAGSSQVASQFP